MREFAREIQRSSAISTPKRVVPIQRQSKDSQASNIHHIAATGTQGSGHRLPHHDKIQASFGQHSISHVQAYTGKQANTASQAMHAQAYTTGPKVAFAQSNPSLHLAAHEAAHVIQQQAGVQLKEGVGTVGDAYEQHADAVADLVVQGKSAAPLLDRFSRPQGLGDQSAPSLTSFSTQRCVQMASTYTGPNLDTAKLKAADWKAVAAAPAFANAINNNGTTGQNTGVEGHAQEIKWGAAGSAVADEPTHWTKFTRLAGPYAAGNALVQGHLINERMGGQGTADNLTPITASANAVHYANVEKPIIDWLTKSPNNYVDYKVTPNYGAAAATLKTKLSNTEFTASQGIARSNTRPNLRTWVGNYIDAVIPKKLKVEVNLGKVLRGSKKRDNGVVHKRNDGAWLTGEVSNAVVAQYNGDNIALSGGYTGARFQFTNAITYSKATNNNTGTQAYAKAIDFSLAGSAVADEPNYWNEFLTLVGPWAKQNFKQGHLINERMGGEGIARNLTPITASANATHWASVEREIIFHLQGANHIAKGYDPVVFYKVTPDYTGANAGLKAKLLNEFDATQNDTLGTVANPKTQANRKGWLDNYIDATFADKLDIEVRYLKKTGGTYAKTNLFKGDVSNEPA